MRVKLVPRPDKGQVTVWEFEIVRSGGRLCIFKGHSVQGFTLTDSDEAELAEVIRQFIESKAPKPVTSGSWEPILRGCPHDNKPPHACPYRSDVDNEPDFRCTCCKRCTDNCREDI